MYATVTVQPVPMGLLLSRTSPFAFVTVMSSPGSIEASDAGVVPDAIPSAYCSETVTAALSSTGLPSLT